MYIDRIGILQNRFSYKEIWYTDENWQIRGAFQRKIAAASGTTLNDTL